MVRELVLAFSNSNYIFHYSDHKFLSALLLYATLIFLPTREPLRQVHDPLLYDTSSLSLSVRQPLSTVRVVRGDHPQEVFDRERDLAGEDPAGGIVIVRTIVLRRLEYKGSYKEGISNSEKTWNIL